MAHRKLAIIRRRVFTALSVLSLLLCVATVLFWVRSYWASDGLVFYDGQTRVWRILSWNGGLEFWSIPASSKRIGLTYFTRESDNRPGAGRTWLFDVRPGTVPLVMIPHWVISVALGSLGALGVVRARPYRRPGHCPRCGYDLRATPERCPECGVLTAETQRTQSTAVV